jgi:hypothetical protein
MPYEAVCPKGHRLQVTEAHFGERVACPTCGEQFVVPRPGDPAPAGGHEPPPTPSGAGRTDRVAEVTAGMSRFSLVAGRPMVALGLILVLLSRGCDAIGKRGVDRAEMQVKLARDSFDDEWQKKNSDIADQITAIKDAKEPKPDDAEKIRKLEEQRSNLEKDQAKARKIFESGKLRSLTIAARDAAANNQVNGYWREVFFVLASILLAIGLLAVGWTAQGAERWISLIMLAIITFSLYIGGTAWVSLVR